MGYPFAWLFCNLLRRFGACFAETAVERTTAIGRAGFAIVACLGVVSPSLSGIPSWPSTHRPSPSLWSSSGTACFNGPNCWVCEAPCYKHFCAYWGMWMKLVCICSSPINRACYNAGCLPDYSQVWASGASLERCSHGACFAEPYHHFHCGVFVWEFEGYEILSHHVDFRKGGLKKKKKKANTTETASLHSAILFSRTCPANRHSHVLLCGNKGCFPFVILISSSQSLIIISFSLFN